MALTRIRKPEALPRRELAITVTRVGDFYHIPQEDWDKVGKVVPLTPVPYRMTKHSLDFLKAALDDRNCRLTVSVLGNGGGGEPGKNGHSGAISGKVEVN